MTFTATKKERTYPKLKLYYFNIPGKGEAIRLACAYGGIPLDDFRMHPNEFHDLKISGKIPFGQVPALSVDDDTPPPVLRVAPPQVARRADAPERGLIGGV